MNLTSFAFLRLTSAPNPHSLAISRYPHITMNTYSPHSSQDLVNAMATINRDLQQAKDLWHKSEQATQDLITGMNIVNGAKNPQAYGAHLKDFAGFPLE